jgi:MinD superfamily P-loop ATPase
MALIVAEPSKAGIHDMHRIIETAQHFGVLPVVCINKSDISLEGTAEIESECRRLDIDSIGRVPFDLQVTCGMLLGQPVTAYAPDCPASVALGVIWDRLQSLLIPTPV